MLDVDYEQEQEPERLREYNLLAAVLHRALLDLLSKDEKEVQAAARYFNPAYDADDHVFSFENICKELSIDAEMLRGMVQELREFIESETPKKAPIIDFHERLKMHSRRGRSNPFL